MSILRFTAKDHKYTTLDNHEEEWLSVTSLVSQFKKPFDSDGQSIKSSKKRGSKWYGMSPAEIKAAWKSEAFRATELGTWYHNQREKDLCGLETIIRDDRILSIVKPIEIEGIKYSPDQKIGDGVYPEHLVYLRSAGICGQSDLVEIVNGVVNITDYKTNKEIKTQGYTSWDGITQKMLPPLAHLDDCNLIHYALQLSVYMYIILKHNPKLKPGKLTLHHIIFEEQGKDKFDYPIAALDSNGEPIVQHVVPYEVPYLKSEVLAMINWLADNKHTLKPKH